MSPVRFAYRQIFCATGRHADAAFATMNAKGVEAAGRALTWWMDRSPELGPVVMNPPWIRLDGTRDHFESFTFRGRDLVIVWSWGRAFACLYEIIPAPDVLPHPDF